MSENRPPSLQPPVEVLKLIGPAQVEATDAPSYSVFLELSRKLTAAEQDAAAASLLKSPAGWVRVHSDLKHLVVTETTIEKVGKHQDALKEIVSKIATEGEEHRKRAVEARHAADTKARASQAERVRRQEAAKTVKFD